MLDELAHAGDDHLDPEAVARYDHKQGSAPDEAAEIDVEVLRANGVGATSTVIDLCAGTGRFALAVAPHVGQVIAVDVSPAMLAVLRDRVAAVGASNVTGVQAGLTSYEHTGPPVDAVHSRNVLHQVPDLFKVIALRRIAEMLRPGGVLRLRDLILDCGPDEAEDVVTQGRPCPPQATGCTSSSSPLLTRRLTRPSSRRPIATTAGSSARQIAAATTSSTHTSPRVAPSTLARWTGSRK